MSHLYRRTKGLKPLVHKRMGSSKKKRKLAGLRKPLGGTPKAPKSGKKRQRQEQQQQQQKGRSQGGGGGGSASISGSPSVPLRQQAAAAGSSSSGLRPLVRRYRWDMHCLSDS